ncbi:hypothetical protein [Bradyrhizobium sp. SZCCHNR1004]|uniref:hypothetical protein n=1 Tax=Bradyrhizobium sp. SZCCHNR1004 TaxID=3057335 RepID=UPI0029161168|nr:hypothetical protein [Bradyrhizobium sp. SZCCHNR1004]
MRGITYWLTTAAVLVPSAALAQAAASPQVAPSVLQQISLALGVPATLLGAAYSWVLISKTRAETKKADIDTEKARFEIAKLTLERQKLERELVGSSAQGVSKASTLVLSSINDKTAELISSMNDRSARNQLASSLILRFIVLGLYQSFVSLFLNPLVIGSGFLSEYFSRSHFDRSVLPDLLVYLPSMFGGLIQATIFLIVGLPLFRDLNRFLGIEMPRFWENAHDGTTKLDSKLSPPVREPPG